MNYPTPTDSTPTASPGGHQRGDAQAVRHLAVEFAPEARLKVMTDQSVPLALHRVVQREHRDLLVLGSSRHARPGHVRIGKPRPDAAAANPSSAAGIAPADG